MNRWGSIRETTFEAIKAPLVAATELTTREKAEKAKAGEEKKRKRVSSGTQKLKDVTGTQRGAFLGGDFPENIRGVDERAQQELADKASRKQRRIEDKRTGTLDLLVEARVRLQQGKQLTKDLKVEVIVAHRKFAGSGMSEEQLTALRRTMPNATTAHAAYAIAEAERVGADWPWVRWGVPVEAAVVAAVAPAAIAEGAADDDDDDESGSDAEGCDSDAD